MHPLHRPAQHPVGAACISLSRLPCEALQANVLSVRRSNLGVCTAAGSRMTDQATGDCVQLFAGQPHGMQQGAATTLSHMQPTKGMVYPRAVASSRCAPAGTPDSCQLMSAFGYARSCLPPSSVRATCRISRVDQMMQQVGVHSGSAVHA